jgi:hypothetical protein
LIHTTHHLENHTMRKLIIAAAIAAFCAAAYASCRSYTINQGGRTVYCTECCYYGNCTVNCF